MSGMRGSRLEKRITGSFHVNVRTVSRTRVLLSMEPLSVVPIVSSEAMVPIAAASLIVLFAVLDPRGGQT
jgi:hypothetical protein